MDKRELQKDFENNFLQLRKIINSWDLIPGAPTDEFDSLTHILLSHLYKGSDIQKIQSVLQSELTRTFGFFVTDFDSESLSKQVNEWWITN